MNKNQYFLSLICTYFHCKFCKDLLAIANKYEVRRHMKRSAVSNLMLQKDTSGLQLHEVYLGIQCI
jgi:hypothetical protein